MRPLLVALFGVVTTAAFAIAPGEIAPGAPELGEEEARLRHLVGMAEAAGNAVSRMQSTWALLPAPEAGGKPCSDTVRLQLGWRAEHFGAAWREAAQATRVQAQRVRELRTSPTTSPLIDDAWSARLDELLVLADREEKAWLESSAWELGYVRPWLAACPYAAPALHPGLPSRQVLARQDLDLPTAILAVGDGWICPGRIRADDGVVFLDTPRACWAPDANCGCDPATIDAGAVLGPPAPEVEPEALATKPEPVATPTPPKTTKKTPKKKNPSLEKGPSPL